MASAVTAISTGRLDEVGRWIDQAARAPAGGPFHDGFRSGVAAADCLRAVHSWLLGDLGACRAAGEAALLGADEPSPWDGVTYTWLGASQFWLGHPARGSCNAAGRPGALPGGTLPSAVDCLPRCAQPAFTTCRAITMRRGPGPSEALALSAKLGLDEYSRITAAAHITRAGLLTAEGRADQARTELTRVIETAHRGSGPVEIAHAHLALSIAAQAGGDDAAARLFLEDARSTIRACPDPGPVITALLQRPDRCRPRPGESQHRTLP